MDEHPAVQKILTDVDHFSFFLINREGTDKASRQAQITTHFKDLLKLSNL